MGAMWPRLGWRGGNETWARCGRGLGDAAGAKHGRAIHDVSTVFPLADSLWEAKGYGGKPLS